MPIYLTNHSQNPRVQYPLSSTTSKSHRTIELTRQRHTMPSWLQRRGWKTNFTLATKLTTYFNTIHKGRGNGVAILVKKEHRPHLSNHSLNSDTKITVKIVSSIGHAFLCASYISPEDKPLHQKRLLKIIEYLPSKFRHGHSTKSGRTHSIPILIYTDAN